jgi:two-component system NtrC family sensor kinase
MRAIIFFLTFSIFVGIVVWRSDSVITNDKMSSHQADVLGQVFGISKAMNAEISSLESIIDLSFSEIDRAKTDYARGRPFSQFQMLAQVLPPSSGTKNWQMVSQYFLERTEVRSWAAAYVNLALASIAPGSIVSKSSYFAGILDPQRRPFLMMVYNSAGNWYVGLVGEELFQGTLDKLKSQRNSYYVVNDKGQALAHDTREYIGSLLTEDPIVTEILRGAVETGNGQFTNLKGERVQGVYQKVDRSNVFIVTTTSLKTLTASKEALRMEIIFLGVGILLVGLAIFLLSDREAPSAAMKLQNSLPQAPQQQSSFSSQQVSTSAEKMKAYTHVASALSHELKPAVTSILGFSQMALNQSNEASKPHIEKIVEEAREIREVLQKLLSFSGEDKLSPQTTSLDVIIGRALKNLEAKFITKGVKVLKQMSEVEVKEWPFELLLKSFESVLINAIEAMDRAPKKELTVKLTKSDSQFVLQISDTGEGIPPQNISRVFEPFFTTRGSSQHVGLGLSTALGIVKELKGEISIHSELGKGTSVTISLPNEGIAVQVKPVAVSAEVRKIPEARLPETRTAPVSPTVETAALGLEEFRLKQVEARPMDPLIVDTTIERLIEGDLPDMPPTPGSRGSENFKVAMNEEILQLDIPSGPSDTQVEKEKLEILETEFPDGLIPLDLNLPDEKKNIQNFTAKIEKPKIQLKKKSDVIDSASPIVIRKPGETR